ncbi:hypothetical protein [Olleya sp. HaHaR_3_96]|uniref:hypothetical protein n=1 Tax=Olleya sp. HaHaR_3_96 TaxID=2745560 RepID=UPI001C4E45F5|nr:hypothetical protein [Olleya sp. HaHaR_3_96]QXP60596.1 hypothetical protein H0I26_02830 [Olleya sp. HaHaR_3_96]
MDFNDILDQVNEIAPEKGYWFVRTDGGAYFEHFYEKKIIAIGWDYINMHDISTLVSNEFDIKMKIAQKEGLDSENSKDKGKITSIYNKIKAFKELRRNDFVIIPSDGSSRLAFGVVADDNVFTDIVDPDCSFHKRRKINWLENKDVDDLDSIFYQVKINRHSISSIKSYQSYIDKVVSTLFLKNGFSHYVLDIGTREDVHIKTLLDLINNITELTEKLNSEFQLGEDIDASSIKLNLQSPGKIEFKFLNGKSLILLAALLGPLSLGSDSIDGVDESTTDALIEFKRVNTESLDKIDQAIDELEIDRQKINSIL